MFSVSNREEEEEEEGGAVELELLLCGPPWWGWVVQVSFLQHSQSEREE